MLNKVNMTMLAFTFSTNPWEVRRHENKNTLN
jgi:hypothetical protein